MRFESPEILWLLGVPVLLVIFTLLRKIGRYPSQVLRLQAVIASILLVALANPIKDNFEKSGNAAVVVDLSESVEPKILDELYNKARELTKEFDNTAIVAFGEKAKVLSAVNNISSYQQLRNLASEISPLRSNLQEALTLASQASSNIILISDGFQNLGNALASSEGLSSKIFPLLPEGASNLKQQVLGISSLDVPLMAAAKKSVDIRSALQNSTASPQRGTFSVFHDTKLITTENVTLKPGEERLMITASDPSQDGIREIKAVFEPQDKTYSKSTKIAYLSTDRREKVLLLSGTSEDARLLQQAFSAQSYELISILPDQQIPNLKEVSTVILNNIASSQLQAGFPSQLSEYVRSGGGFVMIGGNRSYGLGGYVGSSISELLPVDPQPPQAKQKRLTVAVELIIDKSRSMADDNKLDYTKEAAREVVRNLKDEDFVGVIGFDSSPFEVVRLGRVGEIRSQALERIGRLFPAQKTNLFPALDEGRRRLVSVDAGRKHMIVLTDGKIPDADQSYLELVKQMRMSGVTLSTVLVGSDYDFGFLKDMAERGGGAFYQTSDPSSLPRIFLQDVKVRSGEKSMKEDSEFPVFVGPEGLVSTKIDDYPDLLGFVETKEKERARIELQVRSQDNRFPLLASWSVGSGKVVAYTSDANGRWSRPWGTWSRFVPFWIDILDSVRTQSEQSPLRYDLRQYLEGDAVKLNLTLFEDPGGAVLETKLQGPDSKMHTILFSEIAKGSYQAQLPVGSISGRYEFSGKVGKRELTTVAFDVADSSFKEEKGRGFNRALLEEIVAQSSGKINPTSSDLIQTKAVVTSSTSYRSELLIAALVLYLLGIIGRELRLGLYFSKRSVVTAGL